MTAALLSGSMRGSCISALRIRAKSAGSLRPIVIVEWDSDEGVEPAINFAFEVKVAVDVVEEEVRAIGEDDFHALMPDEIDRHWFC